MKKCNNKPGKKKKIRLKQISILNKSSERNPEPFHQHFRAWMEAERDKDNHGRASGIFSRSMASGSYLLLDAAANRLKLPLSLCQDENAQLYLPAEETRRGFCLLGSFSTPTPPPADQAAVFEPNQTSALLIPHHSEEAPYSVYTFCLQNIHSPHPCPDWTLGTLFQMTKSNQKAVRNGAAKGDLVALQ